MARLSKESGIAKSSLFKWIASGATTRLTLDTVFRIADALDRDRGEALRAAAGLDVLERDEEVALILASDRSDNVKAQMVDRLMRRREEERQRRMEDLRFALGEDDQRAG